ncbi:MAG: nucleotide exchange factor GrpE [Verrucomicrobiota bacterium]|jgi:molecular chaperone GrpE
MTETSNNPAIIPPPDPGAELDQLKLQVAENWDKFLRATADFDNYRKRVGREREELVRNTREGVIAALLPAIDNLERALDHSAEGTPVHEGLLQVQKQFTRSLGEFGLVEISAKPGEPFDANLHEAVSHIESAAQPDGAIIEQLQSAYRLGERLVRPARVVVSKGTPPAI